jgi:Cys-tRNA(Pro)/Cys-tRNA(Cys) deacylase
MVKTNAVRVLDGLGIKYELREYEVDPEDLSAETVAAKISLPPEQLFKTLAVRGDRHGICLAVIPGNQELDLKALAEDTGDRKIEMLPLKEVQAATGYVRGGVTALACKKDYPVYIDELAEVCDVISISAGMRGLQILLAPQDYIRAVKAKVGAIAKGGKPNPRLGANHSRKR